MTQAPESYDMAEKVHLAAVVEDDAAVETATPVEATPPQPWATGLCDCFDHWHSCLESCLCLRCQMATQYNMLKYGKNEIHWGACLGVLLADLVSAAMCGVAVPKIVFAFMLRQNMRQKYNLAGHDVEDFLVSLCCLPCQTCQNYRQMSLAGDTPAGIICDTPYVMAPAAPQRLS